jgi:uncharacterized DUF497 family protein
MPSRVRVLGFAFDDENVEKFARHGLTDRQVQQVLSNEHLLLPNRKNRRARYLIIGLDHGGTCIAIPVEATYDRVIWRPVTAWPCKDHEKARLG